MYSFEMELVCEQCSPICGFISSRLCHVSVKHPHPCRHISAIRQGFRVWWRKEQGSEYAVYLTHDLSMLRLIETFCESAPQLTLMIYVMLRTNKARTVQSELLPQLSLTSKTIADFQSSSVRD